jgi:hypothetical protein
MGRGRAKAKQVKVARQLKYKGSDDSDLDRLRAELAVGESRNGKYDPAGDYEDDEHEDAEESWR